MNTVTIGPLTVGNDCPLTLVAGPCQLESLDHARMLAERLVTLSAKLGIGYIFKASFDKANRTSIDGERGIGIEEGLSVLARIREEFGCPVLTDVHSPEQCEPAAQAVDVLQIPAFLCRQTDLLLEAGKTGAAINVKKGQFLAPWDMSNIATKIESTGNRRILLTERGASFGYNMLVNDMRALPIMARTGYPVIFDATHSVQLPGGMGTSSGGQAEFVPPLARAAVAVGVAAVFIETHEEPARSPSDGPNMVPLDDMGDLLVCLKAIDAVAKDANA
ncbi:MAG: 3-deoxy-8-phosphooctulonate synthase [Boseongicola sp.]